MKVLITSPSTLGHLQPMVPLARAIIARGHDLAWAVPDDGVNEVERLGLRAMNCGAGAPSGPAAVAAVMERFPELQQLPPKDQPDVMFGKLWGVVTAPAMLADLAAQALAWRPDVVVSDAAELAGPIVAAELGVPGVTKGFGPLLPEHRVAAASLDVACLWRSRGLEPRPYAGAYDSLYIDPYPPELQPVPGSHVGRRQLLRPERDDSHWAAREELRLGEGRPEAPLVYVTMGTIFSRTATLRPIVAALAALPVRLLVTVGSGDPTALGEQPNHVRVERYVPQSSLLPHCTAVVSHGGSGTVLGTLAAGLPQICLPQGADQFLNAAAVAGSGAGLALGPDEATPARVAAAMERVLAEPAFLAAAGRVRQSIEAMPSADDAAAALEVLAARRPWHAT